jgi:GGDEF domain-containing protein
MKASECFERFPISVVKAILVVLTAGVLTVNVMTIDRINQLNSDLSNRKNEATWFILQLVKEYSNFITETHLTPINKHNLWLAYDLTWSRLDIILNSKESALFIKQANYKTFFESQFENFQGLEKSLTLMESQPDLQPAFQKRVELNFEAMIHFINEKFQIQSPITQKNQTEIKRLLILQKASTVALIILFVLTASIFWVDTKLRLTLQRKDPLTCSLNRIALSQDIKISSIETKYHLLSIRLLNLPEVNHKYGIDYGDLLIKTTAERISSAIGEPLSLYRYTGSQFIVLSHSEQGTITIDVEHDIQNALAQPINLADMTLLLDVTMSRDSYLLRKNLVEKLTQLSKRVAYTSS